MGLPEIKFMLSRLCFMLLAAGTISFVPLLRGHPAVADPASRISGPIVHENIAIYFVHGPSAHGPVPMTLQEALAKGTVEVIETGNVRELEIENKGEEPVFVQFGDLVKGGQQDRVLTVSLVLQPKSGRVPIGAYCVEQGRWSARGKEDAKKFSVSEMLMPSREAKIAMAKPAAKSAGPAAGALLVDPDRSTTAADRRSQRHSGDAQATQQHRGASDGQSEVWRSVGQVQSQLSVLLAAPVASEKSRSSLQLSLENDKLQEAVAAYTAALEPAALKGEDIVGVVFAVNGRISSADVYPSNGLFRKMWPKLVRASITEALAGKMSKVEPAPAPEAVGAFIAEAERGKQSDLQLGIHAKLETRDADKALRTEARSPSGALVHRNYLAKQ